MFVVAIQKLRKPWGGSGLAQKRTKTYEGRGVFQKRTYLHSFFDDVFIFFLHIKGFSKVETKYLPLVLFHEDAW